MAFRLAIPRQVALQQPRPIRQPGFSLRKCRLFSERRTSLYQPQGQSRAQPASVHHQGLIRCSYLAFDPESGNKGVEAIARSLYGLTTAEARLARILTEGRSPNDACDELHIRRTTARTQLRSVFDKLGVNRQAGLVALLLRSVVLVHPQIGLVIS